MNPISAKKTKNDIYSQLLNLSECQKNYFSYKNFGPCFQDVLNINAVISYYILIIIFF